jgi:hypothetical protein
MPQNPWEMDWSGVKTLPAATAAPTRAKTTPQDMMMIRDASNRAETERDARRTYANTRRAITDMSTGPMKASFLDAITPEEDGTPFLDGLGALLGSPARLFIGDKTWAGRDHLKTVGAKVALAAAQQQKGVASDRDMAQMRMSGVNPYKSVAENLRILDEAEREGAFAQHRATLKSKWISRYGSVAAPGPRGMAFEEIASRQDALVEKALALRKRGLPKPPQSVTRRSVGRPTVIDMNGNPVR